MTTPDNEKAFAASLDSVEQLRESTCGVCRADPSHRIRLSEFCQAGSGRLDLVDRRPLPVGEVIGEPPDQPPALRQQPEADSGAEEQHADSRRHAPPWLEPDALGRVEVPAARVDPLEEAPHAVGVEQSQTGGRRA